MTGPDNEIAAHVAELTGDDAATMITNQILDLVTRHLEQNIGIENMDRAACEPVYRGIASAYVAIALALHTTDEAKAMLVDLADALDDPKRIHWDRTPRQRLIASFFLP